MIAVGFEIVGGDEDVDVVDGAESGEVVEGMVGGAERRRKMTPAEMPTTLTGLSE